MIMIREENGMELSHVHFSLFKKSVYNFFGAYRLGVEV